MKLGVGQVIETTVSQMETGFNRLQTNFTFFLFELVFSAYLLINLALIAEHFLMPSLLRISSRYGLSRDVTGIIVAVGNSIPELTTTMLSFMRHGVKMTEFGLASNIGCGIFTITAVPAIAVLATISHQEPDANDKSSEAVANRAA